MIFGFLDQLTDGVNLRSEQNAEWVFLKKSNQVISFRNICTHRGARLFNGDSDEEHIMCPYHGATYDPNTGLIRASRRFDGRLVCERLIDYQHCEVEHGIIAQEGKSLPTEVRDLLPDRAYTDVSVLKHACGSELLIENVLEIEHVTYAHPSTFVPLGLSSKSRQEITLYEWGSRLRAYDRRDPASLVYEHFFVEPNLFVSVTNGQIGYVAFVRSISSCESELVYRFFEGPDLKRRSKIVRSAVLKEASIFTREVLLEDKQIVEGQQLGRGVLSDINLRGNLDERLIHHKNWRSEK
jgi:phenylpropionate dioxygenase-like ring-hydroxylating dioxygenase large terminal subunit